MKNKEVSVETSGLPHEKDKYCWITCLITNQLVGYGKAESEAEAVRIAYREACQKDPHTAAQARELLTSCPVPWDLGPAPIASYIVTETGTILGVPYKFLKLSFEGTTYELRIPLHQYGQGSDDEATAVPRAERLFDELARRLQ